MNKKKGGLAIGLVSVFLGFLLAVQFKSVTQNTAAEQSQQSRIESLQQMLGEEKERSKAQEGLLQQYKEEIDRFRSESVAAGGQTDALLQEMGRAELLAGLTDVTGPGVILRLEDSQAAMVEGADEASYIIHDSDMLMIINELRSAGAEAISINGHRLVSTSEIRCAGSVVSVNNTRTAAPFNIRAIGSPETLYNALMMRGGVVDILKRWKIEISVTQEEKLSIGRYDGLVAFAYAAPDEEGE